MKVEPTVLPEVLCITPVVRADARGSFRESWHLDRYADAGLPTRWAQDNISISKRGVLRGLHFQHPCPQGKLISVLRGEIFDVAVDVRVGSPRFGRWTSVTLSDANGHQLWIPPGFAHGFAALSGDALVSYKCTEFYRPDGDRTIAWDDPAIGVEWPIGDPLLSPKDAAGRPLAEFSPAELPSYRPAS